MITRSRVNNSQITWLRKILTHYEINVNGYYFYMLFFHFNVLWYFAKLRWTYHSKGLITSCIIQLSFYGLAVHSTHKRNRVYTTSNRHMQTLSLWVIRVFEGKINKNRFFQIHFVKISVFELAKLNWHFI